MAKGSPAYNCSEDSDQKAMHSASAPRGERLWAERRSQPFSSVPSSPPPPVSAPDAAGREKTDQPIVSSSPHLNLSVTGAEITLSCRAKRDAQSTISHSRSAPAAPQLTWGQPPRLSSERSEPAGIALISRRREAVDA